MLGMLNFDSMLVRGTTRAPRLLPHVLCEYTAATRLPKVIREARTPADGSRVRYALTNSFPGCDLFGRQMMRSYHENRPSLKQRPTKCVAFRTTRVRAVAAGYGSADIPWRNNHTQIPQAWHVPINLVCMTMFMCNFHRAILPVVALPVATQLGLDMTGLGMMSSAYLWGYLSLQLPAGHLADKYGGLPVLLVGLFLWSLATFMAPFALQADFPLAMFLTTRVIMGAASAAALPAATASLTELVPEKQRSRATTCVYSAFNMGSVMGLLLTPVAVNTGGYGLAFKAFGAAGMMMSVAALHVCDSLRLHPCTSNPTSGVAGEAEGVGALVPGRVLVPQVAGLIWAHSCIGFGFFILQSWIPTFFAKTLGTSGTSLGMLSALPWTATAVAGILAGQLADKLLIDKCWSFERVRKLMMTIATAGPAIFMLLLYFSSSSPLMSTFFLTGVLGTQAFSYAGFHTYVQEVAGTRSGAILGLTNTGSILFGIVGNVVAGWLVQTTGSFRTLFLVTALTYASCGLMWSFLMNGTILYPKAVSNRM